MIIKEMQIGDVKVLVDDTYIAKTEEEKQQRYEVFNSIGCEIMNSSR